MSFPWIRLLVLVSFCNTLPVNTKYAPACWLLSWMCTVYYGARPVVAA